MHTLIRAATIAALLSVAAAPSALAQSINTSGEGTYGRVTLNAGFSPDPYTVSVVAGGPIDASTLSDSCFGNVPQRATFTLNYRAGDTWPLYISATTEGDAVLAVRGPDRQWSCNDDTDGLNPAVHYPTPRPGRYQIYVGMLGGPDTMPATLYISEVGSSGSFGAATPGAEGLPDWSLEPAYGSIALAAGFLPDPHTQTIMAGGELDAANIGVAGCVGAIARAPDYRVTYTSGQFPLIFSVSSASDTTLVINDPSDNWVCDDDGGEQGLNPSVRFESPQSGQYDIWVGTYMPGELQESTLHVSEVESQ